MTLPADPQARLAVIGAEIADRVERVLPGWFTGRVAAIADAWGRCPDDVRAELDARANAVAPAVAARIAECLRAQAGVGAAEQRTTPLEEVRSAVGDVTALLRSAGIPPVERDEFAQRAFPDDDYGCVPASLADLGDDDLGPLGLAWGLAKARALHPDED